MDLRINLSLDSNIKDIWNKYYLNQNELKMFIILWNFPLTTDYVGWILTFQTLFKIKLCWCAWTVIFNSL